MRSRRVIKDEGVLPIKSLPDRICEHLRDLIVAGDMAPGSVVRQEEVALALQVSKIPVREALTRLVEEGLISAQLNRGYTVSPVDSTQWAEALHLRSLIEPRAMGAACLIADGAQRSRVSAAAEAAVDDDRRRVGGRALHLALIQPCGQNLAIGVLRRLAAVSARYGGLFGGDHAPLVTPWLMRDAAAVERHVRECLEVAGAVAAGVFPHPNPAPRSYA